MGDIWVPIIVSVVTGIATVAGVIISTANSLKLMDAKLEKNQAVFEAHVTEQMKQLEKKQDKHNNFIERTYKMQAAIDRHEEIIKELKQEAK